MLRILAAAYALIALAACGSTRETTTSETHLTVIEALGEALNHSRSLAIPQQAAFDERISLGMSTREVARTLAEVAREFAYVTSRRHTARTPGGIEITSTGVQCYTYGGSVRRTREGATDVDIWEYRCYDRRYVLTFHSDRLARIVRTGVYPGSQNDD